ncbi:hypothetical protein GCM10023100_03010 [Actinocorallia cavernae]|uniref:Ketosynthase family 3 (KS3) domain-containing protein n=2 Tax=Actinomycetes TaxID=1760 RepID=A0ABP5ZG66_9ACTN
MTGLACRFPGAPDATAFWDNLLAGRDSVTFRDRDELAALGVPAERLADPRFVPAGGVLEGIDEFDADYFGITPADAALMDPQQRLFLQCAVTALEDAGQHTRNMAGDVAVYASAGFNPYLTHHLLPHAAQLGHRAAVQGLAGGDRDYLATQTSYRLGLTGPSLSVRIVSSLTGRPLSAEGAMSPRYWARQLREPVRFADALRALPDGAVLLEAGPGTALTGFARRTLGPDRTALPGLGRPCTWSSKPPRSPSSPPPSRRTPRRRASKGDGGHVRGPLGRDGAGYAPPTAERQGATAGATAPP